MENRESFFARLTPFMPPSELRKVELAYMMAKFGHRAQTRKELDVDGKPMRYFEHTRRVALILIDELEVRSWELVCAALLHDCLEDTKDVTEEMIEHVFGARVCQIVKILSKNPKEGYYSRLEKYADVEIILVKGADRLDNMRSLDSAGPEFKAKQIKETTVVILPILRQFFQNELGNKVHVLYQKIHALTGA